MSGLRARPRTSLMYTFLCKLTRAINHAGRAGASPKDETRMSLYLLLLLLLLLQTLQSWTREGRGRQDARRGEAQDEQQMCGGRHVWPTAQRHKHE